MNRIKTSIFKFCNISQWDRFLFESWTRLCRACGVSFPVQNHLPFGETLIVKASNESDTIAFAQVEKALIYSAVAVSPVVGGDESLRAGGAIEDEIQSYAMVNNINKVYFLAPADAPLVDVDDGMREVKNVRVFERIVPPCSQSVIKAVTDNPSVQYLN